MRSIAILGGSFDPPHNGHVYAARTIQDDFQFEKFIFLPCRLPVLKSKTIATPTQRVSMLKLALSPYPDFDIDLREIERQTPSYTVDTLKSFRKEHGKATSITWIMGEDAFQSLPQWHHWQELFTLAHLMIIHRSRFQKGSPQALQPVLHDREVTNKNDLFTSSFGKIYRMNAGDYDISSTQLRTALKQGGDIQALVPASVYQFIKKENIYTRASGPTHEKPFN